MLKNYRKNYKGFTLIELLVVVVIIGILAAIALPKYQLAMDKAKYSRAMTLLAAINSAQNRYRLVNNEVSHSFYELDIDLPPSGKISQNGSSYTDTWGGCLLHATGYGKCHVNLGSKSINVWYFLRWDSTYFSSNNRECWVYPKDNLRGNRLCRAMTGKSSGTENGVYMMYYF